MGDIEKNNRRLPWRRGEHRARVYRPGPFGLFYAGLLATGLVATAVVYLVLVHEVPGMRTNRADTLKTALLVIGGCGALAGLYVAYRKQRTDEANHLRDQDKLFTERYTAAVAQLGNAAAAVRLGGVYALARIADDSERDRPTCLSVLCAYLRMPYNPDSTEPAELQVRTTAQAAVADRLRPTHPGFWSDAEVDLSGAYLTRLHFEKVTTSSFNASGASFNGPAYFEEATFGVAIFTEAIFKKQAWFHMATFSGIAAFHETTFSDNAGFELASFGTGALFGGATFERGARFFRAAFASNAVFNGATFAGDAHFDQADFKKEARFQATAFGAEAVFDDATFESGATFDDARFDGGARFDKTTFGEHTRFEGTRFHRDHPPTWPDGVAEPVGVVWINPNPAGVPPDGP
ncbi:pentapeptide repeat-containing protein [Catenulispora subtropica]|uniref:Pentapeptide repeat protein n=1 Tax=Catenulispora subtropica TaxID=450798 RepID=A0ABP5C068_9ACTN